MGQIRTDIPALTEMPILTASINACGTYSARDLAACVLLNRQGEALVQERLASKVEGAMKPSVNATVRSLLAIEAELDHMERITVRADKLRR